MATDSDASPHRLVDALILRGREDVDRKLADAKLEPESLSPTARSLFFDETLDTDGIRLLELDEALTKELRAGGCLTIKAEGADENAVLVTDSATYELRSAETSNLLLVAKDFESYERSGGEADEPLARRVTFPRVRGVFSEYLEARPQRPRLSRLRQLLEENPYSGRVDERGEVRKGRKYTEEELVEMVPASPAEIRSELSRLHALEISGFRRLLDPDYASGVLSQILGLVDENGWRLDAVPVASVVETLMELEPEEVILGVLESVGEELPAEKPEDPLLFAISPKKVAIDFASVLLQKAGRFNLDEFLSVWRASLPDSLPPPDVSLLRGLALVEPAARPPTVAWFPRERLPEETEARFDALFAAREKWTEEDVTPYVTDLTSPKVGVGALLLKYARASTVGGVKYFSSRKARGRR